VRLTAKTTLEHRKERFPTGSVRIPVDQPLGELAMVLLEPASSDSFLQWGFFDEILQRTEYFENYIMEPLAEKMLAADPKLRAEFEKKLESDAAFKASADQRLHFFARRIRMRGGCCIRWGARSRDASRQRVRRHQISIARQRQSGASIAQTIATTMPTSKKNEEMASAPKRPPAASSIHMIATCTSGSSGISSRS
jgi:hypothetical protein